MSEITPGTAASRLAGQEGRNVAIVGSGYVGLASAVCLAELGHRVIGVDLDAEKVDTLQQGVSPIYEAGIDDLLAKHRSTGMLSFTTSFSEALERADFVFVCVGTPPGPDGGPDLTQLHGAVDAIGDCLTPRRHVIVVNKSTLPVGSAEEVRQRVAAKARPGTSFSVVSNPEFLREGRAVYDVLHPDRIVIGADDPEAGSAVARLYGGLAAPVLMTDSRSAEMVKYASNAFLATKISFVNQLAELCEQVGADIRLVSAGMGMDPRIGPGHLVAGLGYGGSCLPKDVDGLTAIAQRAEMPIPLLDAVQQINARQRRRLVERLGRLVDGLEGRTIAIWGLAFKEGTDDLRDAPSLEIISLLQAAGVADVRAYDPQAMGRAMPILGGVTLCPDPYDAARGADALVLVTGWPEFAELDLRRVAGLMRGRVLFDGRNFLGEDRVRAAGLALHRMGVGSEARLADTLRPSERRGDGGAADDA